MPPLISIVLPTIRTGSVSAAIDAVLAQTIADWELIVIPQGDDKALIDLLDGYCRRDARIRYVHTDWKNLCHARNLGMEAARSDIFAFTDDDCEVAPDWAATIVDYFASRPDIGYLGGEVVAPPNRQWWRISTCPAAHVIEGEFHPYKAPAPPGFYMIGANIAIRRSVADQVGKWDTVIGPGSQFPVCDDLDFQFRAGFLGVSLATTKRMVVYHSSGRRTGWKHFFNHQRNYARGRGAFAAKLVMWNSPTGRRWSTPLTLRQHVKMAMREPMQWLVHLWAWPIQRRAAAEYEAQYELDVATVLSKPREERAA